MGMEMLYMILCNPSQLVTNPSSMLLIRKFLLQWNLINVTTQLIFHRCLLEYICCFRGFFRYGSFLMLHVSCKVMFDDENALSVVVNEVKYKLFGACGNLYDMVKLLSKQYNTVTDVDLFKILILVLESSSFFLYFIYISTMM